METADHGAHGRERNSTDRPMRGPALLHEALTEQILGAFFTVYRQLGWGFIESVYANAMAIELESLGLRVAVESPTCVYYRGVEIGRFRADQIIEDLVLIELKAAERLIAPHEQQVINFLKATRLEVALLLNFGPRPSFKRFILTNDRKSM